MAGPFQGTRGLGRCFPLKILYLKTFPADSENPELKQIQLNTQALWSVFLWFMVVQQGVLALNGAGRRAEIWENKT